MDVTGTSAWNAVDNDQPQSSLTTSFHPVNYPETQAAPVQCSEPICNGTSVPSSTQTTSYPCYSPAPETAGQAPNSASTTSVDGNRYTCNDCRVSPKTKRDYERHLKTNKHKMKGNLSNGSNGSGIPGAAVASTGFHCSVEGCKYHSSTGRAITREDNLRRHVKIVHGMDLGRKSEE